MIELEKLAQAQQAIIDAGKQLHAAGYVPATAGNFSVRLDDSHMAITVSGSHKGHLSSAEVMVTDFTPEPVGSALTPSAEARLHAQLYEDAPLAGAILHGHSKAATLLSLLESGDTLWLTGYELQKALEDVTTHEARIAVPIFDNTQDVEALANTVRQRLAEQDCCAYLIRGHGFYTWAQDMDTCLRHVEALDFMFGCELELRKNRS
ncbi:methylthioribulose 1-phosphate dehydratase [Halomonas sp. PR-M31]|uniref:methylthioribulose 1-phosphate dehydratase n=1 Tax=Halomonas sp. PR-M31 TaxID=1471202 RepID=UPI0006517E17|nr:methylthioribulose 1-phosphate dehydratase [Halomonas sp. PR-M31]